MLDTLKVLFILTGASTYLVTKYIRVGVDDKNETLPYLDEENDKKDADIGASTDFNFGITTTLSSKDNEFNKNNGIKDNNQTIGYNISTLDKNKSKLPTMSPYERQEFIRRRYGLPKPTNSDISFKAITKPDDTPPPTDTFVKEYKYKVVLNDNNSSYSRFHFSDDQNIEHQNRPTFEIEIIEEDVRNLPKRLLQVTVSDDKYEPKDIVYSFSGEGIDVKNQSKNKFAINTTSGEIYALSALDRDMPLGRPQWKLLVNAVDAKSGQLVGFADVIINLKDINDNPPFFAQKHYLVNVTENSTVGQYVTRLTAIDVDEGLNAKITYSIEDNQITNDGQMIFAVDSNTGVITTNVCCLDRELHSQYKIKVVATDGDGLKATTTVTITVTDVNDMPPKFSKQEWFVEIDETDSRTISDGYPVPEMPILIVTVIDSDLFQTNNFVFKIVNTNQISDRFSLTANTDSSASLRAIKPLDYEDVNQRTINLTIGVSDNGFNFSDTYHTDYCVIHVRLRDINDNSPKFMKTNIDITVSEDTKVGTILTKFHATDADQSGLSVISYGIQKQSDKRKQFSIDSNGIIRLQRPLDREIQSLHKLIITATDDGIPPLTSTATLTITVDDVNDNAPTLTNDYLSALMENSSPQIIGEIFATDLDDRTKGNGPPFTFKLDPKASDVIRYAFKVQFEPSGDGKAIIYSRTTFDREIEKQYLLPIIITDNGFPSQTSTSTLTIVIGDVNDNPMRNGWKKISVFYIKNSESIVKTKQSLVPIGRVNVDDSDDWDLNDKAFYWLDSKSDPNFDLDQKTGIISIKNVTKSDYELKFTVFDRKHKQEVNSVVNIEVKDIEYQSVLNSGSLRISGITALEFISVWNWRTRQQIKSLYERVSETLKRVIRCDKLEIFSVREKQDIRPVIDVRYYAERQQSLLSSFFLNAIIEQNRAILENELQLNILQIGINECMFEESSECQSNSCETELHLNETNPLFIDSNYSSFVGINVFTKAKCFCKLSEIWSQTIQSCDRHNCFNGGTCLQLNDQSFSCKCPEGADGPNCEITTRSFNGQGWVWSQPLAQCSHSHISVDIITQISNGLILYFGPMNRPTYGAQVITDFMSLEIINGFPRLICDFGSGTQELVVKTVKPLNDGEWHTIEIFFESQTFRLMIDNCIDAVIYDSEPLKMDRTRCENASDYKFFNEKLNINAPLQVGGVSHQSIDKYYNWTHKHTRSGFTGCIRNLIQNNHLFDLGSVSNSANSLPGCSTVETLCSSSSKICRNGKCLGSFNKVECECEPGWQGSSCETTTSIKMFKQHSFIRFNLQFDVNPFSTDIHLLFRTREPFGDLIRLSTKDKREYCVLEIREARVQFKYNLNHLRSSAEQTLRLENIIVNDGKWHSIRVKRFGSTALLKLDGGGNGRFATNNDYIDYHQLIRIERRYVFVGNDVTFVGQPINDSHKICLNDIRIDGRHISMDNSTDNAFIVDSREVSNDCPSNNPCLHITCDTPFECHDIWLMYECRCPNGFIKTTDGKSCESINECIDNDCMKDERPCRLTTSTRHCSCSDKSSDCKANGQMLSNNFNTIAISTLIVCVLNIPLIIILIWIYFRRKRRTENNCDLNENQIEDNIVLTEKNNFIRDSSKRVRLDTNSSIINYANCDIDFDKNIIPEPQIGAEELADIIRDHIERIEFPMEECDNVCVYTLEGPEETVCSLSSLSSMSSVQYNIVYTTAGSPRNPNPLPIE